MIDVGKVYALTHIESAVTGVCGVDTVQLIINRLFGGGRGEGGARV